LSDLNIAAIFVDLHVFRPAATVEADSAVSTTEATTTAVDATSADVTDKDGDVDEAMETA